MSTVERNGASLLPVLAVVGLVREMDYMPYSCATDNRGAFNAPFYLPPATLWTIFLFFSSVETEESRLPPAFAHCSLRSRRGLGLRRVDGGTLSLRSGDALGLRPRWRPLLRWHEWTGCVDGTTGLTLPAGSLRSRFAFPPRRSTGRPGSSV
jgi:hypothetical protein